MGLGSTTAAKEEEWPLFELTKTAKVTALDLRTMVGVSVHGGSVASFSQ